MSTESDREHEADESTLAALPHAPVLSRRCPVTGRRSGCLCVTASGSFATDPGEVAAVRWDGSANGTVAELARFDVEELRPGFTLSAKRYAGALSSAARVEPKAGGER